METNNSEMPISSELIKLYLAYDMADWEVENDPTQDVDLWIEYYLDMRDFDLLQLWLEKKGNKLLTKINVPSLN